MDQVYRQRYGSIIRDAPPPNGNEIAALLPKDDPETRAKRFVYTFPHSGPGDACHCPKIRAILDPYVQRLLPLWTLMHESLQYPLFFTENLVGVQVLTMDVQGKKSQTLAVFRLVKMLLLLRSCRCCLLYLRDQMLPSDFTHFSCVTLFRYARCYLHLYAGYLYASIIAPTLFCSSILPPYMHPPKGDLTLTLINMPSTYIKIYFRSTKRRFPPLNLTFFGGYCPKCSTHNNRNCGIAPNCLLILKLVLIKIIVLLLFSSCHSTYKRAFAIGHIFFTYHATPA